MEETLLLIVLTYGVSLSLGYVLEKYLRTPWMFAALFFGMFLSLFGLFKSSIESESFQLLANLGMLILLFMIGFNLNLREIRNLKRYVLLGTTSMMLLEGFLGSLLLYFVFPNHVNNSYLVALITAFSFATVGEAVLLPILEEFNVVDTLFGQLTLGIGTVDDVLEVLMLASIIALPTFLPKSQIRSLPDPRLTIATLGIMLLLTFAVTKAAKKIRKGLGKNSDMPYPTVLITLLIFFSLTALGGLVFESLATVGAILSGIIAQEILPKRMLKENRREINFLGYAFLSPFFFLSLGTKVSIKSIFINPSLIILIWVVATGTKILASFLFFRKLLGSKYSLLMGLGLSIMFSTSLIVQFILFGSGYISLALYSALVATATLITLLIISVYSWWLAASRPP